MLFEKVRSSSDVIWCAREGCVSFYTVDAVICSQLLVVTL